MITVGSRNQGEWALYESKGQHETIRLDEGETGLPIMLDHEVNQCTPQKEEVTQPQSARGVTSPRSVGTLEFTQRRQST